MTLPRLTSGASGIGIRRSWVGWAMLPRLTSGASGFEYSPELGGLGPDLRRGSRSLLHGQRAHGKAGRCPGDFVRGGDVAEFVDLVFGEVLQVVEFSDMDTLFYQ